LVGIAASLFIAVACSDDEDGDGSQGGGGTSGSAGKGGSSGSSTGGKGGTSTGGMNTGGSSTGGKSGSAGTGPTGGTSGAGGTSGDGGVGGATDGGMGGETDGGMGGAGGEMTVPDVLDNPGFETGDVGTLNVIPNWQESGDLDSSYVEWTGGRNASHKLGHWRAWSKTMQEYDANTFQTVGPIPNGTYSFSMWVNRKLVLTSQYLFARGHDASNPTQEVTMDTAHANSEAGYTQITLSGIVVTSGHVTVGIHTHSWGNDWSNIDDATLTKDP
jgi:hypothetical protein